MTDQASIVAIPVHRQPPSGRRDELLRPYDRRHAIGEAPFAGRCLTVPRDLAGVGMPSLGWRCASEIGSLSNGMLQRCWHPPIDFGILGDTREACMNTGRDMKRVQDWLYVVIVGSLALYLVIGVIAWTWMILSGIAAPDAFATILAAIAGAMAGMITPLQAPGSRDRASSQE